MQNFKNTVSKLICKPCILTGTGISKFKTLHCCNNDTYTTNMAAFAVADRTTLLSPHAYVRYIDDIELGISHAAMLEVYLTSANFSERKCA